MKITLPSEVKYVIDKLYQAGFEAFVVGGCVRDSILCKKPKDWDITTNADPETVKMIFLSVYETGIKHGTVTVRTGGMHLEVTTYRIDGTYSDSRRPDEVKFTNSLLEDLSRRDFTINAMAYNDRIGLVDNFNGQIDLNDKVINCVGNADDRFNEDALRMLRAIRFATQLGCELSFDIMQSIRINGKNLQKISAERIREEFNKILLSEDAHYGLTLLLDTGLMEYIVPEFLPCVGHPQHNPFHIHTVDEHIMHSIERIKEDDIALKLTMFFHDIAKPKCLSIDDLNIHHFYGHAEESASMAWDIMTRLRYDNDTKMKVWKLIKNHDNKIGTTSRSIRKWLNMMGEETLRDMLKVKRADCQAQNWQLSQFNYYDLNDIEKLIDEEVKGKAPCFSMKHLKVNGDDMKKAGFQGEYIGKALRFLLEKVIENPELNDKETLLRLAFNLAKVKGEDADARND